MSKLPPMPDRADVAELAAGYLDGTLSESEVAALNVLLDTDEDARRVFVAITMQSRWMTETFTRLLSVPRATVVAPASRGRASWSLAAAVLLTAAAVAVYVFMVAGGQPTDAPDRRLGASVATLIDTSAGATVLVDDDIARSGGEYRAGAYAINGGTAAFQLTSGAGVELRGPTRLVVHDAMRSTLTRGIAAFDCPPSAVGYAVDLPSGARVVDLGTAFAVETEPTGRAHVYVSTGRVRVELPDGTSQIITAEPGNTGAIVDADGTVLVVDDHRGWRFARPRTDEVTRTLNAPELGELTLLLPQQVLSGTPRAEGYNTFARDGDVAVMLPGRAPAFDDNPKWNPRRDFMSEPGFIEYTLQGWDEAGDVLLPLTTRHAVPYGRYAVYIVYGYHVGGTNPNDPGGVSAALSGQPLRPFDRDNGVLVRRIARQDWAVFAAPLGEVETDELSIDVGRSAAGLGWRTVYVGLAYRPIEGPQATTKNIP